MDTKLRIILLADELIRDKGYNAFSFYDLSKKLGIKNASIHYHFPTKKDLGVAVVFYHQQNLNNFIQATLHADPLTRLQEFINIYSTYRERNQVCIVGSLSSDLHTLESVISESLKAFAESVLRFLTEVLESGVELKLFRIRFEARVHALMIISTLLASLQITRLTGESDFKKIQNTLIKDLTE